MLPDDAVNAIASNAVDLELFNVTRLIRDGYADSRSDSLPVVVGYADKPSDPHSRRAPTSCPPLGLLLVRHLLGEDEHDDGVLQVREEQVGLDLSDSSDAARTGGRCGPQTQSARVSAG
ncbi:hypothetical protein OH809_04245 [Streptomyces sp. NBC_00873]|uniref:hypothetical protein n=1 Tax=unclassified Streptomyces TaxID=2593676 RepID=UPI00386E26F2|nr:hypothetical protein OH809_04245 [Streptomyces sp. NBC_00873]WTA47932.1 hypothetical protein OH821_39555 [Streptomyces sp. NBC_00842]